MLNAVTHAGMPPKLSGVFWSGAIQRAMGARMLADAARGDLNTDLAFTIGLAMEFGTGILLCRESHLQLDWARNVRRLSGDERLSAERELFGMDRTEAFMSVAEDWEFHPETVAIVSQYLEKDRPGQTRANEAMFDIATWAGALGEAIASPCSGKDLRYWATNVSKTFSIADSVASDMGVQVAKRTGVAGKVLGVGTAPQPSSKELMSRNSTGLPEAMDKRELIEWSELLDEQNSIFANRVEELQTTLRQKGSRDVVTGLMTVQALLVQLESEVQTARRRGQSVAIILVDLDGFTALNAHYGYDVGDMVLRRVGETMKKVLRGMELVARVSGDCFALVYSGDERAAKVIGERARAAVEGMRLNTGNTRVSVTATVAGLNLGEVSPNVNAQQFLSGVQQLMNTRHELPPNVVIWKDQEAATAG
jgi:diguanylate cyclase (GGDEF)-like protein